MTGVPELHFIRDPERCPVHRAIQLIGGKWKLLVIRVLIGEGERRFNELLRDVAPISPKVLTENLRELEDAGLIERPERDGQKLYGLTDAGRALYPILFRLGEWAESISR